MEERELHSKVSYELFWKELEQRKMMFDLCEVFYSKNVAPFSGEERGNDALDCLSVFSRHLNASIRERISHLNAIFLNLDGDGTVKESNWKGFWGSDGKSKSLSNDLSSARKATRAAIASLYPCRYTMSRTLRKWFVFGIFRFYTTLYDVDISGGIRSRKTKKKKKNKTVTTSARRKVDAKIGPPMYDPSESRSDASVEEEEEEEEEEEYDREAAWERQWEQGMVEEKKEEESSTFEKLEEEETKFMEALLKLKKDARTDDMHIRLEEKKEEENVGGIEEEEDEVAGPLVEQLETLLFEPNAKRRKYRNSPSSSPPVSPKAPGGTRREPMEALKMWPKEVWNVLFDSVDDWNTLVNLESALYQRVVGKEQGGKEVTNATEMLEIADNRDLTLDLLDALDLGQEPTATTTTTTTTVTQGDRFKREKKELAEKVIERSRTVAKTLEIFGTRDIFERMISRNECTHWPKTIMIAEGSVVKENFQFEGGVMWRGWKGWNPKEDMAEEMLGESPLSRTVRDVLDLAVVIDPTADPMERAWYGDRLTFGTDPSTVFTKDVLEESLRNSLIPPTATTTTTAAGERKKAFAASRVLRNVVPHLYFSGWIPFWRYRGKEHKIMGELRRYQRHLDWDDPDRAQAYTVVRTPRYDVTGKAWEGRRTWRELGSHYDLFWRYLSKITAYCCADLFTDWMVAGNDAKDKLTYLNLTDCFNFKLFALIDPYTWRPKSSVAPVPGREDNYGYFQRLSSLKTLILDYGRRWNFRHADPDAYVIRGYEFYDAEFRIGRFSKLENLVLKGPCYCRFKEYPSLHGTTMPYKRLTYTLGDDLFLHHVGQTLKYLKMKDNTLHPTTLEDIRRWGDPGEDQNVMALGQDTRIYEPYPMFTALGMRYLYNLVELSLTGDASLVIFPDDWRNDLPEERLLGTDEEMDRKLNRYSPSKEYRKSTLPSETLYYDREQWWEWDHRHHAWDRKTRQEWDLDPDTGAYVRKPKETLPTEYDLWQAHLLQVELELKERAYDVLRHLSKKLRVLKLKNVRRLRRVLTDDKCLEILGETLEELVIECNHSWRVLGFKNMGDVGSAPWPVSSWVENLTKEQREHLISQDVLHDEKMKGTKELMELIELYFPLTDEGFSHLKKVKKLHLHGNCILLTGEFLMSDATTIGHGADGADYVAEYRPLASNLEEFTLWSVWPFCTMIPLGSMMSTLGGSRRKFESVSDFIKYHMDQVNAALGWMHDGMKKLDIYALKGLSDTVELFRRYQSPESSPLDEKYDEEYQVFCNRIVSRAAVRDWKEFSPRYCQQYLQNRSDGRNEGPAYWQKLEHLRLYVDRNLWWRGPSRERNHWSGGAPPPTTEATETSSSSSLKRRRGTETETTTTTTTTRTPARTTVAMTTAGLPRNMEVFSSEEASDLASLKISPKTVGIEEHTDVNDRSVSFQDVFTSRNFPKLSSFELEGCWDDPCTLDAEHRPSYTPSNKSPHPPPTEYIKRERWAEKLSAQNGVLYQPFYLRRRHYRRTSTDTVKVPVHIRPEVYGTKDPLSFPSSLSLVGKTSLPHQTTEAGMEAVESYRLMKYGEYKFIAYYDVYLKHLFDEANYKRNKQPVLSFPFHLLGGGGGGGGFSKTLSSLKLQAVARNSINLDFVKDLPLLSHFSLYWDPFYYGTFNGTNPDPPILEGYPRIYLGHNNVSCRRVSSAVPYDNWGYWNTPLKAKEKYFDESVWDFWMSWEDGGNWGWRYSPHIGGGDSVSTTVYLKEEDYETPERVKRAAEIDHNKSPGKTRSFVYAPRCWRFSELFSVTGMGARLTSLHLLEVTPEFSDADLLECPNLENLTLKGCTSGMLWYPSLGKLISLKKLDIDINYDSALVDAFPLMENTEVQDQLNLRHGDLAPLRLEIRARPDDPGDPNAEQDSYYTDIRDANTGRRDYTDPAAVLPPDNYLRIDYKAFTTVPFLGSVPKNWTLAGKAQSEDGSDVTTVPGNYFALRFANARPGFDEKKMVDWAKLSSLEEVKIRFYQSPMDGYDLYRLQRASDLYWTVEWEVAVLGGPKAFPGEDGERFVLGDPYPGWPRVIRDDKVTKFPMSRMVERFIKDKVLRIRLFTDRLLDSCYRYYHPKLFPRDVLFICSDIEDYETLYRDIMYNKKTAHSTARTPPLFPTHFVYDTITYY